MKIAAWDLETGLPEGMGIDEYDMLMQLRSEEDPPQRHSAFELWPFPITVGAVSLDPPYINPHLLLSHRKSSGWDRELARWFLAALENYVSNGYVLVGWNTTRFDFPVLGRLTDCWDVCRRLCLASYDIPYQVLMTEGFIIGQDATCKGLGLPGKPQHDMGAQAPVLWAARRYKDVEDYCASDAQQLQVIFQHGLERRHIRWQTKKGTLSAYPLPFGWLRVEQLLHLKAPDQSWLDDPMPIEEGIEWLTQSE